MCAEHKRVTKMTHSTGQEKKNMEDKLRDTPRNCSLMDDKVLSYPADRLHDLQRKVTMVFTIWEAMPIVFPVWKATTTTILEVEREQLLYSCYTNSKWAVDIKVAKTLQFAVSTEPSIISPNKEQLSSLRPVLVYGIVYTVGRCGKSILKLMGIHSMPILASQSTFNFAKLDTLFSSIDNTENQRPIAIESFTEEDTHANTPNDLLLHRNENLVPGVVYGTDDSITRRQEVFRELEQAWWDRWIEQALPHIVPVKEWKHKHLSMVVGDAVFILFKKRRRRRIH
jgi:hypothetical protein